MFWDDETKTAYQSVTACAFYLDEAVGRQPKNNPMKAVEAFINNNDKTKIRYLKRVI